MEAIGYVRVSTDEQARSGLGRQAQQRTILDEARRRGWDVEWSVDDAYSARSMNGPAIQAALERFDAGDADVLVVSKLDRLSRSLVDSSTLLERARTKGWAVVDTSTPAGELVANVMASVAQWERRVIGMRTAEALEAARQRGQRLGRPVELDGEVRARIAEEVPAGDRAGLERGRRPYGPGRQALVRQHRKRGPAVGPPGSGVLAALDRGSPAGI